MYILLSVGEEKRERRESCWVDENGANEDRACGVELGKREFLRGHFVEFLGPDGKGTAGT